MIVELFLNLNLFYIMNTIQKNFLYLSLALLAVSPQVSFAAFERIKTLLRDFKSLLDLVVPIVFALALIFFFYGIAQFIRSAGDTKTLESGKNKMIWGIVGLFVMISIWGIIKYLGDSLGIETNIRNGAPTRTVPAVDPANVSPGCRTNPDGTRVCSWEL